MIYFSFSSFTLLLFYSDAIIFAAYSYQICIREEKEEEGIEEKSGLELSHYFVSSSFAIAPTFDADRAYLHLFRSARKKKNSELTILSINRIEAIVEVAIAEAAAEASLSLE